MVRAGLRGEDREPSMLEQYMHTHPQSNSNTPLVVLPPRSRFNPTPESRAPTSWILMSLMR